MPATSSPPPSPPQALLEALLRLAPLDVLLFDTDLVCRYAAPATGVLFGRGADDLLNQHATAIFDPAHGDLHTALRLAAADAAGARYPSYRYTAADAETQTYYCWSVGIEPVSLLDYRGREEFRGVLVTLTDVQDLADERDRLRTAEGHLLAENADLRFQVQDLRSRLAASEKARQDVQASVRDLLAPLYGYLQVLAHRPEILTSESPQGLAEHLLLPRVREIVAAVDNAAPGTGGVSDRP
jgi:hypothetical protein